MSWCHGCQGAIELRYRFSYIGVGGGRVRRPLYWTELRYRLVCTCMCVWYIREDRGGGGSGVHTTQVSLITSETHSFFNKISLSHSWPHKSHSKMQFC